MRSNLITLLAVAACGSDPSNTTPDAPIAPTPDAPGPQPSACEHLDLTPSVMRTDLAWYGNNRTDLTTWLDSAGCPSGASSSGM
jgi:hypothetical protein